MSNTRYFDADWNELDPAEVFGEGFAIYSGPLLEKFLASVPPSDWEES